VIVNFRDSFGKDLKKGKDVVLLARVKEVIAALEATRHLDQIPNLKRLKGGGRQ